MPGALATIGILDKDGNPQTVRVWDESGTGVGPFQFVKMVSKADGVVVDPATSTKQPALGTAGAPSADVLSVQGVTSMTALKIDGSAVTQPVSAVALPLPTGAATAAKQPALGTAGTPATDVLTVQGAASMTALKTDGSAVTQPVAEQDTSAVSGSVTSAAVLFTADMHGYESASVQITNAGTSCIVSYETSDDNSNWVPVAGLTSASTGNSQGQALSNTAISLQFSRHGRYFRARVSTYGSGTVSAVGNLSKCPMQSIISAFTVNVGYASHGGASSSAPGRIAARSRSSNYTTVANDVTADLVSTLAGSLIVRPHSIPEAEWSFAVGAGGILNTTSATTIVAAAGAGLRNYLTSLQISSEALGTATEVAVRDGAGGPVLWRTKIGTAGLINAREIVFSNPLKSTANTLLEIVTLTASGTGAVYVNAQGYIAP